MRRTTILPLALALAILSALPATAAERYAVSVSAGSAGPCRVGAPLPRGLEALGPGLFRIPEDGLLCRAETSRVTEIRITSPLFYTREHLLRVGSSTIADVVKAHGRPTSTMKTKTTLVLTFARIRVHFGLAEDPTQQRSMKLSRFDLIAAAP
jgi:hypothetical protein